MGIVDDLSRNKISCTQLDPHLELNITDDDNIKKLFMNVRPDCNAHQSNLTSLCIHGTSPYNARSNNKLALHYPFQIRSSYWNSRPASWHWESYHPQPYRILNKHQTLQVYRQWAVIAFWCTVSLCLSWSRVIVRNSKASGGPRPQSRNNS